ncbi:MAG: hypothetical protein V4726_08045 [Verrucomicrobiota bacterium]
MEQWRRDWPRENWAVLATAAAKAAASGELGPEALARILNRWKREQPEAAAAWEETAPADSRSRFLASLRARAALTFMRSSDKGENETAAVYEQRIRQAIQKRGEMPLPEALLATASAWSAEPAQLVSLLESQNDNGSADAALALAIRRLWGAVPPAMGQKSRPELPEVPVLQACESITDASLREPLIIGLFRRWHVSNAPQAEVWLKSASWPEERLTVIRNRLAPP